MLICWAVQFTNVNGVLIRQIIFQKYRQNYSNYFSSCYIICIPKKLYNFIQKINKYLLKRSEQLSKGSLHFPQNQHFSWTESCSWQHKFSWGAERDRYCQQKLFSRRSLDINLDFSRSCSFPKFPLLWHALRWEMSYPYSSSFSKWVLRPSFLDVTAKGIAWEQSIWRTHHFNVKKRFIYFVKPPHFFFLKPAYIHAFVYILWFTKNKSEGLALTWNKKLICQGWFSSSNCVDHSVILTPTGLQHLRALQTSNKQAL